MNSFYKNNRLAIKYAAISMAIVFAVLLGYIAGRQHLAGKTLRKINKVLVSRDKGKSPEPDQKVEDSANYKQLNHFLDNLLTIRRSQSSLWSRILQTDIAEEQKEIKRVIREKFQKHLNPWPSERVEINATSKPWLSQGNINISIVSIQTHPGIEISCALLMPPSRKSKIPAILALHGMYGNLNSMISDIDYHHGFGMELAKKGFVVLAPYRITSTIESRNTIYLKSLAYGWSLEAIDLWQLVRSLDFLISLDEVDKEHVGVFGISLGGQHALWLSAIDKRLSLTMCSGYFVNRFDWLFKRKTPSARSTTGTIMTNNILPIDNILYLPDMNVLLDDLNLVSLILPRYFSVIHGKNDPRYDSAKREFSKVLQLYKHLGSSDKVAFIPLEGGHEVYVTDDIVQFLNSWANNDTTNGG